MNNIKDKLLTKFDPLIQKVMPIYNAIYYYYLDYTYKIPTTAGMCFAYYLIMAIVPIFTIIAFLASFLNLDLTFLRDTLTNVLTDEFADLVLTALQARTISLSSLVAIAISFYVVSKGINQVQKVAKNLFPPVHERNFLVDKVIAIFKTIVIFILIILIMAMFSLMPVLNYAFEWNFFTQNIFMFLTFFGVLFLFYKVIPDVHVHIKDILMGSLVAALLMIILIDILTLYFSHSNYSNVYGSLAMIVIILYTFNFSAHIIYFGLYVMFESHMKRMIKDIEQEMAEQMAGMEGMDLEGMDLSSMDMSGMDDFNNM